MSATLGIEYFKSVLSAEIKDCPKFKPEFPKAQGKQTMENATTASGELPQFPTHIKHLHKRQHVKRTAAIIRDIIQTGHGNVKTPIKWRTSVMIEDVESFPEELLKNMSCFQKLHINNCPKLLSLPKGLKNCTSLQELEISGCPELEARCRNENGADWRIAAHIPYIQINAEYIKWDAQLQSNRIKAPVRATLGLTRQNRVRL